eukprot:scaffold2870_cov267-Pinguiococcus_pyrenoidosus.AAC.9
MHQTLHRALDVLFIKKAPLTIDLLAELGRSHVQDRGRGLLWFVGLNDEPAAWWRPDSPGVRRDDHLPFGDKGAPAKNEITPSARRHEDDGLAVGPLPHDARFDGFNIVIRFPPRITWLALQLDLESPVRHCFPAIFDGRPAIEFPLRAFIEIEIGSLAVLGAVEVESQHSELLSVLLSRSSAVGKPENTNDGVHLVDAHCFAEQLLPTATLPVPLSEWTARANCAAIDLRQGCGEQWDLLVARPEYLKLHGVALALPDQHQMVAEDVCHVPVWGHVLHPFLRERAEIRTSYAAGALDDGLGGDQSNAALLARRIVDQDLVAWHASLDHVLEGIADAVDVRGGRFCYCSRVDDRSTAARLLLGSGRQLKDHNLHQKPAETLGPAEDDSPSLVLLLNDRATLVPGRSERATDQRRDLVDPKEAIAKQLQDTFDAPRTLLEDVREELLRRRVGREQLLGSRANHLAKGLVALNEGCGRRGGGRVVRGDSEGLPESPMLFIVGV